MHLERHGRVNNERCSVCCPEVHSPRTPRMAIPLHRGCSLSHDPARRFALRGCSWSPRQRLESGIPGRPAVIACRWIALEWAGPVGLHRMPLITARHLAQVQLRWCDCLPVQWLLKGGCLICGKKHICWWNLCSGRCGPVCVPGVPCQRHLRCTSAACLATLDNSQTCVPSAGAGPMARTRWKVRRET